MSKTSKVDKLIAKIKMGQAPGESEVSSKPPTMMKDGPATFSYPEKIEPEKFIDYERIDAQPMKPNMVKFHINEGEERFPPEAKVPNYTKYDANGNYIKHKPKMKKAKETPGPSTGGVVRSSVLSNPYRRKRKKP